MEALPFLLAPTAHQVCTPLEEGLSLAEFRDAGKVWPGESVPLAAGAGIAGLGEQSAGTRGDMLPLTEVQQDLQQRLAILQLL